MSYTKTQEVFNFITAVAREGKAVTYQEIAQACNLPAVGNNMSAKISPILSNIFLFCQLHELPYLTSIVVRKSGNEAGLPGVGFWKLLERVRPEAMYDAISSGSRARKVAVTNQMQNEVWRQAGTFTTTNVDLSLLDIADDEPDHLSLMVNEKLGAAVLRKPLVQVTREHTVDGTAPLSGEETDAALEQMRQMLANSFGVTLVHDHNGAYGPAGQRHLTLRFGDYTVSTVVTQVSSYDADTQQAAWEREDK